MASRFGEKSLRNSCLALIQLNFSFLQRFRSIVDISSVYYAEDMDVCKCIVPSRHGGTLNNREAASLLVRLVAGDEKWKAPDPYPRVFFLKIEVEQS
ncbi:hypothetical protein TNCV_2649891 [Trichonephila clavipes]|nr:hypothetical protein TNCV_2649891 [Trichonephila clavipes]